MEKVLIVVDAPGPAEFIFPVIPFLKGYKIKIVTVKDSPTKVLEKYKPVRIDRENEAKLIYRDFNPGALLIAVSSLVSGPYIVRQFTELAYRDKEENHLFSRYLGQSSLAVKFSANEAL